MNGLCHFASSQIGGRNTYAVLFRAILMIGNTFTPEVTLLSTGMSRKTNLLFQNLSNQTCLVAPYFHSGTLNKHWNLLNEAKAHALKFLKVVWHYLFEHRPANIFDLAQNESVIDSFAMVKICADTLILLPSQKTFNGMFQNSHVKNILAKCLQLLSVFVQ